MAEPLSHTGQPTFSLRNRLGRLAWAVVWLLLFRPSPRPAHFWRRWLLRLFGARVARGSHIYPGARVWAPWNFICGEGSCVADRAILYNQATISLGAGVVVSQGTHLCTGSHDYESWDFELFARPIHIHDHAWLAAECFVHPGVTIGEGAVVGARSVVVRDVPPWMVCAGHPCHPLKPRVMRGRKNSPSTA